MAKSLMEQIAELPPDLQREALDGIDPQKLLYDWTAWARPEQLAPPGKWNVWLILAGRGFGKTRAGSEWCHQMAMQFPGCRIALLGRTSADARDVMVIGDSGIMNVGDPAERPEYEPSKRRLTWPNGSTATIYSADTPDQLRGPQAHFAWADEIAAYPQWVGIDGLTAFDNLRIATRLGENPQVLVTTTPKRVPIMHTLLKEADEKGTVAITRGKTSDNASNLSEAYLNVIYGVYEGTHLAAQELEGILMDDVEGALWFQSMIDSLRVPLVEPKKLRVVGVDPSVAENPKDECGIVVATSLPHRELHKREAWVLEDASIHGSPDVWAKRVVETARKWRAPVVAEGNQGGALVKQAIQNIDPDIPVFIVNARVGKATRAEPVQMAYEQGRVHHVGFLPELEAQMTSWVPAESKKSPDRMDALVWALTALLVNPPKGFGGGPLRAKSAAGARLPTGRGTGMTRQRPAGGRGRRAA